MTCVKSNRCSETRRTRESDVEHQSNTLDLVKREAQTATVEISYYQQGMGHKITDWQKFRELCQHEMKTQAQMWLRCGERVSQQNISDAMRHIVQSKKRHMGL